MADDDALRSLDAMMWMSPNDPLAMTMDQYAGLQAGTGVGGFDPAAFRAGGAMYPWRGQFTSEGFQPRFVSEADYFNDWTLGDTLGGLGSVSGRNTAVVDLGQTIYDPMLELPEKFRLTPVDQWTPEMLRELEALIASEGSKSDWHADR